MCGCEHPKNSKRHEQTGTNCAGTNDSRKV